MKQLIACIALALITWPTFSQSQEKIFEFDRPSGKPDKFHAHSNTKGETVFFVRDGSDIRLLRFDNQFSKIGTYKYQGAPDESPGIITGTTLEDTVSFYSIDSKTKKKVTTYFLKSWDFKLKESTTARFDHALLEAGKIIASYAWQDQFYVLSLPIDEEQKILRVHIFKGPRIMDSWKLPIESDDFDERLKSKQFQQIKTDEFVPFRSVISSNKLYHKENKIWVISDLEQSSLVAELDLTDRGIKYREFKTREFEEATTATKTDINSFILADKLFQWYVYNKAGRISIYDLSTGDLTKEIALNAEEEVTTKNGPMIQTDWPQKTKTVLRTKSYFRKVAKNDAVVTVNPDKNNNYTLEIGAVHNLVYNNFNSPWMDHWLHQMNLPPTNIPVPSFTGPSDQFDEYLIAFLEGNVVETFSFPMVLHGQDLAFIPGGKSISKHYNVQDAIEDITKSMKRYTTYKYLDHYHICSYNKKEKKFEVFEVKAPILK